MSAVMGPIETSLRARAVQARRNLSRGVLPSIQWTEALPKPARRFPVKSIEFVPAEKLAIAAVVEVDEWPAPSADQIIAEVCTKHGVKRADLVGPNQSRNITPARFEAMYRIREERSLSWAQIGRLFHRDHTTVLAAWRRHKQTLEASK